MKKIKFPYVVNTRYETTIILSLNDLITIIKALSDIEKYRPTDWERSDAVMLEALESLYFKCGENGYED